MQNLENVCNDWYEIANQSSACSRQSHYCLLSLEIDPDFSKPNCDVKFKQMSLKTSLLLQSGFFYRNIIFNMLSRKYTGILKQSKKNDEAKSIWSNIFSYLYFILIFFNFTLNILLVICNFNFCNNIITLLQFCVRPIFSFISNLFTVHNFR